MTTHVTTVPGTVIKDTITYSYSLGVKDYPPSTIPYSTENRGGSSGDRTTHELWLSPVTRSSRDFTSVNSSGIKLKKRLKLAWILRKPPKPPRKPVPTYRPPALPIWRPPSFRKELVKPVWVQPKNSYEGKGASKKQAAALRRADIRFRKKMLKFGQKLLFRIRKVELARRRWQTRYDLAVKHRKSYNLRFPLVKARLELRWSKYREALLKYVEPQYKIIKNQSDAYKIRNPYTSTRIYDYGTTGRQFQEETSKKQTSFSPGIKSSKTFRQGLIDYNYIYGPYTDWFSDYTTLALSQCSVVKSSDTLAQRDLKEKLTKGTAALGIAFAELHQTVTLVKELTSRLIRLKRDPVGFVNFYANSVLQRKHGADLFDKKSMSNDYLAYQFGLKPLILDLIQLAETLKSLGSTGESVIIRASGKSQDTWTNANPLGNTYPRDNRQHYTISRKVSYALEYSVSDRTTYVLSKLGLTNLPLVAWEVIPFSFVVDWLLPIGSFLESLDSETGLTFVSGTKTVVLEYLMTGIVQGRGTQFGNINNPVYTGDFVGSRKKVQMDRTVLSSSPLNFVPTFKSPISVTHILESLALLNQRRTYI